MPFTAAMLAPVIALVLWSLVMQAWMYATRVPAMFRARMVPDRNRPQGEQMAELPARVRWKADNYNHLMEQPTLFYAVALSLAVLGDVSLWALVPAWAYVALRVVHSLVQALANPIMLRFAIFNLSSLVLLALTLRAAVQIFG